MDYEYSSAGLVRGAFVPDSDDSFWAVPIQTLDPDPKLVCNCTVPSLFFFFIKPITESFRCL